MPCHALAQTVIQGPGEKPQATASSGLVNSVTGDVFMRKRNGEQVRVKPGDLFEPGAQFTTGANAQLVLLFSDGQHVTLTADSVFRIDDYQFDARNPKASRASFGLMSGMMRIVTGVMNAENGNALRLTAGNALITILDRDVNSFVVEADARAPDNGSVAVIVGQVSISRPVGPITTVAGDQFSSWQSATATSAPQPLAVAPAGLQAAAASRATLLVEGVLPDVEAAALKIALANQPPPGAGAQQQPAFVPVATPGPGGCVGSRC